MSKLRLVAHVGPLRGEPGTRHTMGTLGGADHLMPLAEVVLMEVLDDGPALLYRFTRDGVFAGDTWHECRENAEDQLEYELGDAVDAWTAVPLDVEDAQAYAVKWAQRTHPER
ncbi:hypothetical protein WME79_48305 [Sorangium sp. So ce726]|uniref:hypothetical protein n=1 Tax=Sorangium sp. So ce726 TaxID=3133319 RepID=UPI003F626E94